MNVLITGGAGFIGSHLAQALVDAKHSVTVLDDLSGGFERNVPPGAHLVKGSITNDALVDFLFKTHDFDAVYHLAAYAAEGLSHFIRKFNYTNNVLGSVNLINAAIRHNVVKFVFTSSMAVYGDGAAPFHEDDVLSPVDPYGAAKLAIEHDLAAAASVHGLRYTIFRPHNVYGARQHIGDRFRNVVGIFMNQILKGLPLTVFGDGEQTRAFSYVEDILQPMIDCAFVPHIELKTRGEAFNIGGEKVYTINQLARAVCDAAGKDAEILHLPERHEVKAAHSEHAKLLEYFGKQPQTPLEVGLKKMWQWAEKLGPQEPTPAPEIELEMNLPPSWIGSARR